MYKLYHHKKIQFETTFVVKLLTTSSSLEPVLSNSSSHLDERSLSPPLTCNFGVGKFTKVPECRLLRK